MVQKIENPFIISGRYVGPEYFCDRVSETAELVSNIVNWRNTVLVSSRRMGKSGLIEHCFSIERISREYRTFYIDIFATSSIEEFVLFLSKEICSRIQPSGSRVLDKFLSIVSSLKALVSADPVTGLPSVEFSMGEISSPVKTLEQIFRFMEESDRPCVVAIDEFQQIAEYPDGLKIIAKLRTLVQSCRQTRFIFAGSNRRMMGRLFNSPSEPFFMSCSPLYLEAIDREKYKSFAKHHFSAAGKSLEDACFESVYDRFQGHTWYVQSLLNRLYESTEIGGSAVESMIEPSLSHILDIYNRTFQEMLSNISDRQKSLLIAIAGEGEVSALTSAAFIAKYHLRTSSAVQGAAKALLENETIVKENDKYHISNRFFSIWLKKRYL